MEGQQSKQKEAEQRKGETEKDERENGELASVIVLGVLISANQRARAGEN
jgi:hypothetical protein